MEAGDTMHQFYSDIFQRVSEVWRREGGEREEGGREKRKEREEERRRGKLIHLPSIYLTDPGRRPLAGALLPQCCTAGGATKPVSFTGEEVLCTQHVRHHVILALHYVVQ